MISSGGSSSARAHHPDYGIALIVTILLAIGLVIMYSISPILSYNLSAKTPSNYYFLNQLKFVGIGIVLWIAAISVSYDLWRRWAPRLVILSAILLLALLIPGLSRNTNGATRWLALGPLSVQPAEILKISLILYLAAWFEKRGSELKTFSEGVIPFAIMVGIAGFVIIVLQRDMGTMVVLACAAIGMYFAAGLSWKHVGAIGGLAGVAAVGAMASSSHRLASLKTFLHMQCGNLASLANSPEYHSCQALIAAGSGGLFGLGLGHSIQVYGYLPEAANDSIFAIIAEEFGLLGSLAIVILFGLLVWRGLQVAKAAPDMFGRLAATGISLWMLFQAIINVGAMVALMPLTGIPLPFISYGGTNLVISLLGIGILLNISKYTVKEASNANNRQRRGDSGSYNANLGNMRRVKVAR